MGPGQADMDSCGSASLRHTLFPSRTIQPHLRGLRVFLFPGDPLVVKKSY